VVASARESEGARAGTQPLCEVAASDRHRRVGPMPMPAPAGRARASPRVPVHRPEVGDAMVSKLVGGPCLEHGLLLLERRIWARGTVARNGNDILLC